MRKRRLRLVQGMRENVADFRPRNTLTVEKVGSSTHCSWEILHHVNLWIFSEMVLERVQDSSWDLDGQFCKNLKKWRFSIDFAIL
jgi:hypothetical protein